MAINWKRAAKSLWHRINHTCEDWCDGFDAGRWTGRNEERARIVALIRANPPELEHGDPLHGFADDLETEGDVDRG